MAKSIKQEILDYIREKTKKIKKETLEQCTANAVSSELMISRSLASQYLNDLVKDHYLIKIKTRPVAFLSKYQLEKLSGKQIVVNDFLTFDDLNIYLYGAQKNFEKMIGYEYGLKECIEKIKTAIHYPHGGLPIMIYGKHGSGKTFLAEMIREYLYDNNMIESEEQSVYLNCNNRSGADLEKALFGCIDEQGKECAGALKKAKEGLIVLDNISSISASVQDRLLQYLEKGTYNYVGQSEASEARLVFVVSEAPNTIFEPRFLGRFPIIVELPSLKNRTIREKTALIIYFFERQAMLSSCEVVLSDRLVNHLINQCSEMEVLALKQYITLIFAKAYKKGQKKFRIGISYLSNDEHFLADLGESYYPLEHFAWKEIEAYKIINGKLSELISRYHEKKVDPDQFYRELFQMLGKFNDSVIFDENYLEKPLRKFERYMESLNTLIEGQMNIKLSGFMSNILAKYLYLQSYYPEIEAYAGEELLGILGTDHPAEYEFAEEFADILEKILELF